MVLGARCVVLGGVVQPAHCRCYVVGLAVAYGGAETGRIAVAGLVHEQHVVAQTAEVAGLVGEVRLAAGVAVKQGHCAAGLAAIGAGVPGFQWAVGAGDADGFDREAGPGAVLRLGVADAGEQQPRFLARAELLGVGRVQARLVGEMREAPGVEEGHGVHQAEAGEQE